MKNTDIERLYSNKFYYFIYAYHITTITTALCDQKHFSASATALFV